MTELPLVAGKDVILVVCDRLSKMTYFVAIIRGISTEGLAILSRDNIQKLHELPESIVLDRRLQFVVELIKKLNKMLEIETKLLILFHLQTDSQTERMNQKLEQYLWFFVDYKQKDWPEQLATAEFAVNSKIYSATKMSLFIVSYSRELRIGVNIRRKEKVEKVTIKKIQKEVEAVLRKVQKEMKRQADKERRETKE